MKIDANGYYKTLKDRREKLKGREHTTLYCRLSYSIARYHHIRDITPFGLAVYITLQSFSNTERIAFPSMSTIAKCTGINPKTVSNSLKLLEKKDWIENLGRIRNTNGTLGSYKYKLKQSNLIRMIDEPGYIKETPLPPMSVSEPRLLPPKNH